MAFAWSQLRTTGAPLRAAAGLWVLSLLGLFVFVGIQVARWGGNPVVADAGTYDGQVQVLLLVGEGLATPLGWVLAAASLAFTLLPLRLGVRGRWAVVGYLLAAAWALSLCLFVDMLLELPFDCMCNNPAHHVYAFTRLKIKVALPLCSALDLAVGLAWAIFSFKQLRAPPADFKDEALRAGAAAILPALGVAWLLLHTPLFQELSARFVVAGPGVSACVTSAGACFLGALTLRLRKHTLATESPEERTRRKRRELRGLLGVLGVAALGAGLYFLLAPTKPAVLLARAREAVERNDLEAATVALDEMVESWPDDPRGYRERGDVRSRRDDPSAALTDFDRAVALAPNDPDALWRRGQCKSSLHDWRGAEADYSAAVRLSPRTDPYRTARALARQALGDFKGALEDYDWLVANKRPHAYHHTQRAHIRSKLGDRDGALADLSEAIRLDPKPWLFRDRGLLRASLGDAAGAEEDRLAEEEMGRR